MISGKYGHNFLWLSIRYGQLVIPNVDLNCCWIPLPITQYLGFSADGQDKTAQKKWKQHNVELMAFQQYCAELRFNGFRISALQTCVAKNLFTSHWPRSWNPGLGHRKLTDWKHKTKKQLTCLNSLDKARFSKMQLQEMYVHKIAILLIHDMYVYILHIYIYIHEITTFSKHTQPAGNGGCWT